MRDILEYTRLQASNDTLQALITPPLVLSLFLESPISLLTRHLLSQFLQSILMDDDMLPDLRIRELAR